MADLFLKDVGDVHTRENFQKVQDHLTNDALTQAAYKFFEIDVPAASTNFKFAHKLGYTPKDVLQTGATGAGGVTWNYDLFDSENLDITTTGAVKIRVLIGSHK